MTELWTIAEVAQYFKVSESGARNIVQRAGVQRVFGYPADQIRVVKRPGRGARTDLKEKQ